MPVLNFKDFANMLPIIINSKLEGLPRDLVYDFAKLPLHH